MREMFRNFGIGKDDGEDTPVAVFEGWPLAFEACHLYYPKLETEEETKAFAKQAIAWANQVRYDGQKIEYGDSNCSCVSQTTIDNLIKTTLRQLQDLTDIKTSSRSEISAQSMQRAAVREYHILFLICSIIRNL